MDHHIFCWSLKFLTLIILPFFNICLFNFFLFFLFIYMWVFCLLVCLCTTYGPSAFAGQTTASGSLGLESDVFVSHMQVLRVEPVSCAYKTSFYQCSVPLIEDGMLWEWEFTRVPPRGHCLHSGCLNLVNIMELESWHTSCHELEIPFVLDRSHVCFSFWFLNLWMLL